VIFKFLPKIGAIEMKDIGNFFERYILAEGLRYPHRQRIKPQQQQARPHRQSLRNMKSLIHTKPMKLD
jgi:hypothetical protein